MLWNQLHSHSVIKPVVFSSQENLSYFWYESFIYFYFLVWWSRCSDFHKMLRNQLHSHCVIKPVVFFSIRKFVLFLIWNISLFLFSSLGKSLLRFLQIVMKPVIISRCVIKQAVLFSLIDLVTLIKINNFFIFNHYAEGIQGGPLPVQNRSPILTFHFLSLCERNTGRGFTSPKSFAEKETLFVQLSFYHRSESAWRTRHTICPLICSALDRRQDRHFIFHFPSSAANQNAPCFPAWFWRHRQRHLCLGVSNLCKIQSGLEAITYHEWRIILNNKCIH